MNRIAAAVLLGLLCGCAAQSGGPTTAAAPATGVTRSVEQGGKFIALVGPRREHAEPFLGVPSTNFYALRSWIDTRTGEAVHQLYVEDSYFGAERNWNAARDGQGHELRFIEISKNEITCEARCSYAEEFAASLPEDLLKASPKGLSVTFTSRSGDKKTIEVTEELIEQQLAAVAEARASRPSASIMRGRRS